MKDIDKKIIKTLADNDLSGRKAAEVLYMGSSSIYRHVKKIKKETGLNPFCFWDLIKLLKTYGGVNGGECI